METNMDDRVRLLDIADSIREIQAYVGSANFEDFTQRDDLRMEITGQLLQIGGAAAQLSDEFKDKYREIDWDVLKGLQYSNFDQEYELDMHPHWHIVKNDLPAMLEQITDLATELERNESMEDEIFEQENNIVESREDAGYESEAYLNKRLGDQIEQELNTMDKDLIKAIRDEAKKAARESDEFIKRVPEEQLEGLDIQDDSFIDQRFEDVNLMQDTSLDDVEEEEE
jgi:uncharacterized protein with HEPN domain